MSGLAEVLAGRMALGTSGRWIAEYRETPETLTAAVVDWLTQRLGEDDVREAVARAFADSLQIQAADFGEEAVAALAAVRTAIGGGGE